MRSLDRRSFLARALGSAAAASLAFSARAAPRREPGGSGGPLGVTPLGDDLLMITGAGCNIVATGGSQGALLVDGGLEHRAAELIRLVLESTRAHRIGVLFNTHWHPEQTGSNERIGRHGASIIAHENTRLWLGRPIEVDWLPKPYGPLQPRARPNKTTYTTDTLTLDGRRIEYGYMAQAHTDGDLYVHFPKEKLLIAGGVVSNEGWPIMDYRTGGWIAGLVAGYDKLIQVAAPDTRIVPANGPLLTRADLQSHRTMYFTIYDRLVKHLMKGLGPEEVIAQQPAKEFAAQWGDPDRFIDSSFRSLWGHFAADA